MLIAATFAATIPAAGAARPPVAKTPAKKKPDKAKEPAKERPAPLDRPAPPATATADDEGRALQRGERVEFDARLIQGQTAKAGAVYLFARVGTNLRSMVKERVSFREQIIQTVFSIDDAAPRGPPAEEDAP